jgi:hypothetical protein
MVVWNDKCATLSATSRATLFFATNLAAGSDAALAAMAVEFALRFTTSGFYGALTQSFGRLRPPALGTAAALIIVPALRTRSSS